MDDFMHDIYTRLVEEAAGLVKFSKKSTLSASEFQTATRLILPGELAKHAVSDATKAVASFMKSKLIDAAESKSRQVKQSRIGPPVRPEIAKGPIEIEILRPVDNEEAGPAIQVVEEVENTNEVPSRKRKAIEEIDLETEPVASTSTPRKSPVKRPVPTERRSALEVLESLETPHKEDNKVPEESGGESEVDVGEERAPPTPPTENESEESYQSLPEAEDSAHEVEEKDVTNTSEPDVSVERRAGDDVNAGAGTSTAGPSEQKEEAQPAQVIQEPDSITDVPEEAPEKPSEEKPSASIAPAPGETVEPEQEASPSNSQEEPSSEETSPEKSTRGAETDNETVTMDTETSLESEDPLISVRVQVHRGDGITSEISIFDRTAEGANQQSVTENAEADTSTNENDANLNSSLAESQPSLLSEDSDVPTFTQCYTATSERLEAESQTVVTVKYSKTTTKKTVITRERREHMSEYLTETEK